MSHPKHPNCPLCSKALFKSAVAAKVKPADPYAYCRNPACADYTFKNDPPADPKHPTAEQLAKAVRISGKVLSLDAVRKQQANAPLKTAAKQQPSKPPKVDPAESLKKVLEADKLVSVKNAPKRKAKPAPEKPAESEPLAKARKRIREILDSVGEGAPKESIGLVLAIVNQEAGSHKSAEILIDEFKLDEKFGLQKFTQKDP